MPEGTPACKALPHAEPTPPGYAARLGVFSGTMMVVGGIIGSGIFLNPAIVAVRVRSVSLTLAAWILGGVIALIGALVYAELGSRRPLAGGGYVYLRDAYGRLPAFLYAWTLLLVIATGAIAAVAVTFANYTSALLGLGESSRIPLSIGAILLLSAVNYLGVRPGAITQNVFTLLKLAALAALIAAGFAGPRSVALSGATESGATTGIALALGAAMVPVLFSYGGWQQTNFVAQELKDPTRNLPRALVVGVTLVVAVYLLANVAYLRVLGLAGLASSSAPAADAMEAVLGRNGRTLIASGIALSTFGFLNLVILVSPRVYQAMASDGLFFPSLARLHPRYRTPAGAIVFQGAWAVILTLTGRYADLLDYVVFGDWIFFGATAGTLFLFRARERVGEEPTAIGFRMRGHPAGTAVFVLAAFYVVAGSIASNPLNAVKGTVLILLGIPVFRFWDRRRAAGTAPRSPRRPPRRPDTPPDTSG